MAIKGDFISFTYNGVHSTELGIVHVSTSNRYTDALLPTIQDKTVQVPGSNGTYFFGSYYTQRPITLNVAFDNVSENQVRLARKVFGDQLSHPLIFDEEPYKVYYAKVSGTPQYNYIPFNNYDSDQETRPRIYKGEGTITFTCYEPFAHTPNSNKYLSQYTVGVSPSPSNPIWYKYDNKNEWNYSANLLAAQTVTESGQQVTYDSYISNQFKLYNPGDLEADFKFIIPIPTGEGSSFSISGIKVYNNDTNDSRILNTSAITIGKGEDVAIQFNSKTNLIEGLDAQGTRTGNLYNEGITAGSWFKIPITTDGYWYFQPIDYSNTDNTNPILEYDYLYF